MESRRARHHWGPNLAQYHYLEKRYGKKTRAQVFWATTGLLALLIGSIVAVQIGETYDQRKARVQGEQAFIVRIACTLGEKVCYAAKEDTQKVNCKLFLEDCSSKVK